jgi:multimeric flavodoxin WrbA
MKKVLGIIGSQRRLGNCEIMVKEISRQLETPHELQLLRLPDFNISYCNACYRCLMKEGGCVLKDDFSTVLNAIIEADALILAVPTYLLGAHGCLKVFLDRGLAFYKEADKLWGKPAVGVGIAGIEGKEGSTLLEVERFFYFLRAKQKQSRILYAALPGEVVTKGANREAAKQLAGALFAPAPPKATPCCPVCGGQTFRFLSNNSVRCMLCSNAGDLDLQGEQPKLAISEGDHKLGGEDTEHRDWLIGMKERYWSQRENLKKIKAEYAADGDWLEPKL